MSSNLLSTTSASYDSSNTTLNQNHLNTNIHTNIHSHPQSNHSTQSTDSTHSSVDLITPPYTPKHNSFQYSTHPISQKTQSLPRFSTSGTSTNTSTSTSNTNNNINNNNKNNMSIRKHLPVEWLDDLALPSENTNGHRMHINTNGMSNGVNSLNGMNNGVNSINGISSINGTSPTSPNKHPDDIIPNALVVKNIPFCMKREDLLTHIASMGLPAPYAFNFHYEGSVFRGLAFANFNSSEDAGMVLHHLNGLDIGGRKLKVEWKKVMTEEQREKAQSKKEREIRHKTENVDMNSPVNLQMYSRLLLFKAQAERSLSNAQEMMFENTDPPTRRVIHVIAHDLNLHHESIGEGNDRKVIVSFSQDRHYPELAHAHAHSQAQIRPTSLHLQHSQHSLPLSHSSAAASQSLQSSRIANIKYPTFSHSGQHIPKARSHSPLRSNFFEQPYMNGLSNMNAHHQQQQQQQPQQQAQPTHSLSSLSGLNSINNLNSLAGNMNSLSLGLPSSSSPKREKFEPFSWDDNYATTPNGASSSSTSSSFPTASSSTNASASSSFGPIRQPRATVVDMNRLDMNRKGFATMFQPLD